MQRDWAFLGKFIVQFCLQEQWTVRMKVGVHFHYGEASGRAHRVLFNHLSSLDFCGNVQLEAAQSQCVSGSTVTLTMKAQLIQANF